MPGPAEPPGVQTGRFTEAMRFTTRLLLGGALFCLSAPAAVRGQDGDGADPDETAFLRAVGKHFETPAREVLVLSRWGVSTREIPVVLRLSRRAGVSPDVVVAQRRNGDGWMKIARGYSVHAGEFHVPIDGSTGFLGAAYERFDARSASEWREISLSDEEVVGLVNVRFLSRALGMAPGRVLEEMGDGRDVVGVFIRLGGGR